MTAIAGLIRFDHAPVDRAILERMVNLLEPYGRDAQHTHFESGAAFLRTLLRITPEDRLDRQPLVHAENQTLILFDGRLDNREELAGDLGIPGEELRLLADGAIAQRACLRWDTAAVDRLLGDFALACWQPRARRLWLARDPLGTRPLYWHQKPDLFAFATLPKALFAIPGVDKAICEERLHDYLCLLPMIGPDSFFKGIYRVEPGQILVLDGEAITTHRYHRWDPDRELRLKSDDDYLEAFREQVERSVACRLRSSGLIASYLSSGFDSSTVAALAARQLAAENKLLIAYTSVPREGFDGPVPKGRHGDEGPGARALAARFPNIEHHLIRTTGTTPLDHLEEDVQTLDRPPLNPCNTVWVNAIAAAAARRGAKVLLTGGMGNMTISYTGREYLPWLFGQRQWAAWWREMRGLKRRQPAPRWRGLLLQSVAPYLPPVLWGLIERIRSGRRWVLTDYTAIHPDFMERMGHANRVKATGWDLSYRPWGDSRRMRIAVLERMDNGDYQVAANADGLERRDPTADRRLIEFCLAVPDHQYLCEGRTRWLLHRLMGDTLPPEILLAQTRGYQAADWYESMAAAIPRIREELASQQAKEVGKYLD
ncbi:MAG: asparagine synthetase B, partial [Candidatus Contendobacter sp.]|nr:asparagine synthetase B [Candidatus Contendobacter sp.]